MADITHYFVRHIDVYQVNNVVNINIHARYANLPTIIKETVNGTIMSVVGNDPDVSRKLFLDHCYV